MHALPAWQEWHLPPRAVESNGPNHGKTPPAALDPPGGRGWSMRQQHPRPRSCWPPPIAPFKSVVATSTHVVLKNGFEGNIEKPKGDRVGTAKMYTKKGK